MFDKKKGLGFNIARYNIPGGGMERSKIDPRYKIPPLKYRFPEGFKATAKSNYNWSEDSNQRTVLLGAIKRGSNVLEAFSNSPPAWMTVSGDVGGSRLSYEDNLAPKNFQNFADYLADTLQMYRDKYNVTFDTLDPFNEPVEGQWIKGSRDQEGCNFGKASISQFIPVMYSAMKKRKLSTKLAVVDSTTYNSPRLFKSLGKKPKSRIYRINVHSYELRKSHSNLKLLLAHRSSMYFLGIKLGKSIAVSEGGPWGMRGSEVEVALQIAKSIMIDINVLRTVSWAYWQAVEEGGKAPFWGLIHSNRSTLAEPFTFSLKKQYFVMMQFSRFIPENSIILKVHPSCSYGLVASFNPSESHLVIIVANYLLVSQRLQFLVNFSTISGESSNLVKFRTSEKENFKHLGQELVEMPYNGKISLLPQSIMTLVFTHVARDGSFT